MSRRALIIAIENYPLVSDGSLDTDLERTVARARLFRFWLTRKWKREGISKHDQHVIFCSEPKVIGGRGASIKDLTDALLELKNLGRNMTDELYFYFSGHGFTFDKKITRSSMLITADFRSMDESGGQCANLDWIVLWLTMNMGAGRHYYFIDACRNLFDSRLIQPPDALLNNNPDTTGEPDSFLLQSSRVGEVAPADGTFADALLAGLAGRGIAKIWDRSDPDAMVVRFDTLRDFVKQRINRKIHQNVSGDGGDASGLILRMKPPPMSKCTIHLVGGEAAGTAFFEGERTRLREPLKGTSGRYDVPPDTYRITLDLGGPSTSPKEKVLTLYDDAEATFSLDPLLAPPDPSLEATVITVPPDTSLTLTREGRATRTFTEGTHRHVPRGKYGAVLSNAENRVIRSDELILTGTKPVDIGEWTRGAIRKVILDRFPKDPNGRILLSPALERALIDTDLDILLSLLGAAKILEGDPRVPANEIARFPLGDFASENAGSSPVFVLGAFEDDETKLEVSIRRSGAPDWSLASTSEIESLRDFRARPDAGPLLVSLRKAGDPVAYTLQSIALRNRVTLITVTQDSDGGFTIGQYFIPLGHLAAEFDYPTSSRHGDPLLDVLATSRMTRSFRRRRNVLSDLQFYSGRDLVEGNWKDPLAILLAAYEALRRRRQESDLPTLVSALERFFSEMPDTQILASRLRGATPRLEKGLPIFMDGFVAAGGSASDLPTGSSLDYTSIWTAWHELPSRK
ncbi:MAG: caspase family protein [Rhizobiales bacterium]|nr:caspase family protein [Hyphomicrobiales bacterium]